MTKKVAAATKQVAKNTAPKGLVAHTRYSIKHVREVLSKGLDGAASWVGSQINAGLVSTLIGEQTAITSARVGKTDRVLYVMGRKAFAWALTGLGGDVYERAHDKGRVRGSIAALQKAYGKNNVRLLSKAEAVKLLKTVKADAGCAKALGVA